ncbi:hypothetical protein [Mesorhizobium denitrificans]|uniref:Uncharacterized protein n=1 Tax=Mesorhizobium denitrificans TaxID=2294114 RepID=A0A371XGI2_9HYPH|nr:hypothetical protein [Mesorhizobium denitrificans]RFC68342.1 hypothetical protein DY251_05000 [Mesorhizobium denitrificans]
MTDIRQPIPLPPGFVLEDEPQQPSQQTTPQLPGGFVLDAPPALESEGIRQGRSAAQGFADLATWGLADEAAAAVGTLGGMLPGGHGKGYSELLDEIRHTSEDDAKAYPKSHLAGQVLGAVGNASGMARGGLSLAANATQAGKGWFTRLLSGGADGGLQAAGYGFGSGEGVQDRMARAAYNFPLGAALGSGGELLATGIGAGSKALFRGSDDIAKGVNPAANVQTANEFGIPLSRAQATRSIPQSNIENQLRSQGSMSGFDAAQREALGESVNQVQRGLAGPNVPISSASSAYEAIPGRLRSVRDMTKAASKDAYKVIDDNDVLVSGEAVRSLPDFIRNRLTSDQILIDPMYHQGAARAMAYIDDYIGRLPKPSGDVKNIDAQLRWVESLRAGLRKNFPPIGQDAPALKAISGSVDQWMDDIFDNGLVSASDDVLDQLKTARSKWSDYMSIADPKLKQGRTFNPQYEAQRAVKAISEKDMSPEEIGQYLWGSSVASPKNMSFMTAQHLRKVLGPDSPEWSAVRQSFWLRATRAGDEALNPSQIAKNLDGLLNGQGKSVASTLFSDGERELMGKYLATMRMLSPAREGLNTSNTANRMLPQLQRYGTAIMGTLAGGGGLYGGLGPLEAMGVGALATGALKGAGALSRQAKTYTATRVPVPKMASGQGGVLLRAPGMPLLDDKRQGFLPAR